MPQFGASLTDASRAIIYDRDMFKIQATDVFQARCQSSFLKSETTLTGTIIDEKIPAFAKEQLKTYSIKGASL
jgi:hypothetical protein